MTPDSNRAILVVGPSWVGDMVLAQGLFKLLKRRHPERRLDVLAPDRTLPLLTHMAEVDGAVAHSIGHGELKLGTRRRLASELRESDYGWAIVLPNSFKSALIPFWAGIPRRTGYLGEGRWGLLNDWRRPDRKRRARTVDRFVALGLPRGAAAPEDVPVPALTPISQTEADAALQALDLERPARRLLALCPGSEYGPAKRWPEAHFAELARTHIALGWSVWLFGSAAERAVTATIREHAGEQCVDLAGRTELGQAVTLLSLADAVVSNDSGLMHVAAAMGKPQVAIFGSSSPAVTPPLSARATVLSLALSCSPCYQRRCPLGHQSCLWGVPPESVRRALEGL